MCMCTYVCVCVFVCVLDIHAYFQYTVLPDYSTAVPSEHDEKLAQILLKMPRYNLKTLSFLCHHLHE